MGRAFKRGGARIALLVLLFGVAAQTPVGAAFADTTTPTTDGTFQPVTQSTTPTTAPATAPADTTATTVAPDTTATTAPATTATTAPAQTTATTAPPQTTTTTTTPPPAPAQSSIIVKFNAGVSEADQQASIARNGGTDTGAIPALQLHSVNV